MFPLQENEQINMYVRRHWIWLAFDAFVAIVLFIVPVIVSIWLRDSIVDEQSLFFNYPVIYLLDLFVYLWAIFCFVYFADRFTKYALNFWVLTNMRLVESEHVVLFTRKLSTLPLETIEDVTVKYDGILETVIGFGSLTVQTAGTQREFLADDINDPDNVKQAIFEMRESIKNNDRNVTVKNIEEMIDVEQENKKNDKEGREEMSILELPVDQIHQEIDSYQNNINQNHFSYDWANVEESQRNDIRNVEEQININDKYKSDIDKALRYE